MLVCISLWVWVSWWVVIYRLFSVVFRLWLCWCSCWIRICLLFIMCMMVCCRKYVIRFGLWMIRCWKLVWFSFSSMLFCSVWVLVLCGWLLMSSFSLLKNLCWFSDLIIRFLLKFSFIVLFLIIYMVLLGCLCRNSRLSVVILCWWLNLVNNVNLLGFKMVWMILVIVVCVMFGFCLYIIVVVILLVILCICFLVFFW